MLHRLIEASLRQRVFLLIVATVSVFVGLWSAYHLPIDAVPDITSPQVQVNTEVPALAPEESEKAVTIPLEMELAGIQGVEEMRSLTKFGLSQVTLIFKEKMDIYRARQLVAERLQSAADRLPPNLTPKLAPISTGLGEIFYYTLAFRDGATNRPPDRMEELRELREIHEFVVKPMLRTTPGLAEINSSGGYEKQLVVQPRPEDLQAAGLTFADLAAIIGENVENTGGGVIHRGPDQLIVRSVGRVRTAEEIAELPIKFASGIKPLVVRDVAEVAIGSRFRTGAATENGEETILGTAMMLAGENSRFVARRFQERIREIADRLPPGLEIRTQYDRSELVDRTVSTVKKNLFEGAILVVVVLLGMLGNWRAALIVSAAIPLSFLFALTGMLRWNISGNLMSLGAVDFGLIIDGAVVMVENIVRQLGERQHALGRPLTASERIHTVGAASKQVANPMFFGVLIITIVYVPILALTGVEGKMFHPMAITVMLALGGALVMALTLMPVFCSYLLSGSVREGDNLLVRGIKKLYEPSLRLVLEKPWLIGVSTVLWVAFSVWAFLRLGAEFVPKLDEGSHTVMVYRTNSMNLETSLAMEMATEKLLLTIPEVERVFCRLGTSEVATDPMPPSQNDLYIFYQPRHQWRQVDGRPITKVALAAILEEEIQKKFPEQSLLFAQPIEMRFNELLEGVRSDLSLKIIGYDYDVMEELAARIKKILDSIPGASEVEFEAQGRAPVLEIVVNREALKRYSLHAAALNQTIATALAGQTVGLVYEGDRRYEIVVRLQGDLRDRLDQIRKLPVRVGEYGLVSLGEVAEFKTVSSVDPIVREDGHRRVALMINLRGRDVESFVKEAQQKIAEQITLPQGYSLEFGGQFKNLQEARLRLLVVVPAALILIFLLIFMAFGSLRQAFLIYTGIPLAITGGVLALWGRGMPFSITAAVGFIALSGVAVLNGVVMISYFNELREKGRSMCQAVFEGAVTRLRPVLMTAFVASLGFVPMAVATGPGAEVQRPLATVVIGGILSSTFLTLVLLPVLYAWFEGEKCPTPQTTPPSTTPASPTTV
ncbi:MAG TPA: CusA/CzcA family heavy metal efflux RND transporter [Candidatus Paceibacterota bacterium]|nr:CusA/CzcA family heavy metal efflux RND transporter [Verrucomicrobiota bacterium]HRY51864.1 CusA/CzcA family heavy metal efflux RND transporter [Candidatus Paceibacterota bacterium]HRZ99909.1 CusA/CzcA family heavy metal efflux RND transporter [Candidatus Paceibacterota bacterium]